MINRVVFQNYVKENGPIKISIAGAGYIAKGLVNQISLIDGVRIVAIASKTRSKAEALAKIINDEHICVLDSVDEIPNTDADFIIDLTGDVETGARLAVKALKNNKHFMASAETDATVGPVLAELARKKGLIYTNMWGDEPGLTKGLFDYVDLLGFDVIAIGKFKGYHNNYATPESVSPWAEKSGQNPVVISSFADGSKMSMEMAVLANSTGFLPDVRGMNMPEGKLSDVTRLMSLKEEGGVLNKKRVLEVIRGAEPSGAVFAVVRTNNRDISDSFKYYKLGDGPSYLFYTPYHLPGIEMIFGIIESLILNKASIEPIGRPICDVVSIAKRDLSVGDILDDIGGFDYFGMVDIAENADEVNALPLGLASSAKVVKSISKGELITYSHVVVNNHPVCEELRLEYKKMLKDKSK